MAAKKNNSRREERIAKNNRNLNRALGLFTAGFIAEFYLLLINQYFVKGTVSQLVAASYFLEVMLWVGLALVAAGVVFTVMRERWTRFVRLGGWLLGIGVFLTLSSELMLKIYPAGTTAMCILVPVLMLLCVVFLLYEREFAVQSAALTLTIGAAALLNHGSTAMAGLLRAASFAALAAVAVLLALVVLLKKNGGKYKETAVLPAKANYALTCAVLAACIAVLALALFAGLAYYVIWGAAVALFALAVYYTVKML